MTEEGFSFNLAPFIPYSGGVGEAFPQIKQFLGLREGYIYPERSTFIDETLNPKSFSVLQILGKFGGPT